MTSEVSPLDLVRTRDAALSCVKGCLDAADAYEDCAKLAVLRREESSDADASPDTLRALHKAEFTVSGLFTELACSRDRLRKAFAGPVRAAIKDTRGSAEDNERFVVFGTDFVCPYAAAEAISTRLLDVISNEGIPERGRLNFYVALAEKLESFHSETACIFVALKRRIIQECEAALAGIDQTGNHFVIHGAGYFAQFDGESISLPKSRGVWFLHLLLRYQGRSMRASELERPEQTPGAVPADAEALQGMSGDQLLEQTGLASSEGVDGLPALDKDAIKDYRIRLREIADARGGAERSGNTTYLAELDHEAEVIATELRASTNVRGETRWSGGEQSKAVQRVRMNIDRTLATISEEHPSLGEHLRAHIKRDGRTFSYSPEPAATWQT